MTCLCTLPVKPYLPPLLLSPRFLSLSLSIYLPSNSSSYFCSVMMLKVPLFLLDFDSQEQSQVELELTLLEALEIYPPVKLRGKFASLRKKKHILFLVLSANASFSFLILLFLAF